MHKFKFKWIVKNIGKLLSVIYDLIFYNGLEAILEIIRQTVECDLRHTFYHLWLILIGCDY